MKTSKREQFNKGIERLKNTHLSLDAKNSIKERLSIHTKTYIPKIKTPYFTHIHFSYRAVIISFVLVFSLSIGTTYASFSSLPGDVLYPIKTNFTEPMIKFTKKTKEEKEAFDLVLADTRISEIEELIKKDTITEAKLDANLALFEKHLDEIKRDRSEKEKTKESNEKESLDTAVLLKVDLGSEEEKQNDSDSRINKYRDIILSKPSLNDFYEKKAKTKLDSRRNKSEQKEAEEKTKTVEEKGGKEIRNSKDDKSSENKEKNNNIHETEIESEHELELEDDDILDINILNR